MLEIYQPEENSDDFEHILDILITLVRAYRKGPLFKINSKNEYIYVNMYISNWLELSILVVDFA
jgi:hypothetical protein